MIYLTLMIFINEEQEEVFHQFEDLVLPMLADYHGRLIYRLRPTPENFVSHEEELPYEIHFLSFESEQGFKAFSQDKRREAFLHLKDQSIRTSFLVKGLKL